MWTHLRRAVLAAGVIVIVIVSASMAAAAALDVVSVKETSPGAVTATVRTADSHPARTSFQLLFPGASSTSGIVAKDVAPLTTLPAELATPVILCVDRSGSMRLVVPAIKQALQDAFATPRPDLQVAVLPFGSTIAPPQPFTANQATVVSAVSGIQAERGKDGKTLLYDTVNRALNRLRDQAHRPGRLLVISDGKDEGSQLAFDSLLAEATKRGTPIDTIAVGNEAKAFSGSLEKLSAATGGTYVLATSGPLLTEAIGKDLGTRQAPAFDVHFEYAASSVSVPANLAKLQYAAAGASTVSVPVNASIAAPLSKVESPVKQVKPQPPPVRSDTWMEKLTKVLSGSSPIANINIGSFGAALLLLAAALAWAALFLTRRRANGKEEPVTTTIVTDPVRPARAPTQIAASFPAPARGRPAAHLIGRSGPWRGKRFPIEKTMIHIGAGEQNDLVITGDEYVSRNHATIRFEAGTLYLSDLSSTNGTFLNGIRLSSMPGTPAPGDEIRFGRTTFELQGVSEGVFHRNEDRHKVP